MTDSKAVRGPRERSGPGGDWQGYLQSVADEHAPIRRFGTVEEFGDACAFLCSAPAVYIVGQNLLLDGGAFPGTF